MKYYNYVAIMEYDGTLSYVTKVDNGSKVCYWKSGDKAKTFTKTSAQDLVYGLVCNGFKACVVTAPDFIIVKNIERGSEV